MIDKVENDKKYAEKQDNTLNYLGLLIHMCSHF